MSDNQPPELQPKRQPKRNQYKYLRKYVDQAKGIYFTAWREHRSHTWILEQIGPLYKNAGQDLNSVQYASLTNYIHGLSDFSGHLLEWKVFHRGALKKSSEVPDGDWLAVEADKGQHCYPNSTDTY